MLTLILADAELELVPKKINTHPSVVKNANRRGKEPTQTLLDASLHHKALRELPQGYRRGRPDIAHFFLVLCMDSILNREGGLRVLIHTRRNKLIRIKPTTRVPKNYNRFVGLIEQLFERYVVPGEDWLLKMEDKSLRATVEEIGTKTIVLSRKGKARALQKCLEEDITCLIGGFPKGDFLSPVEKFSDVVVCLYKGMLAAYTVAWKVIDVYEQKF